MPHPGKKAQNRKTSAVCGEAIYGIEEPPGFYRWLRETTGGDYHAAITVVKISNSRFDDAATPRLIEELRVLPKLDKLDLRGSSVTEGGVSMLQSEFPMVTIRSDFAPEPRSR